MDKKYLVLFFLVFLIQPPSFTVDIVLTKSYYQPGETLSADVIVWNGTDTKICLKTLVVTVEDSQKVLCTLPYTYPVDTECCEPGEEKVYTSSCDIPLHAQEGEGRLSVHLETWGGTDILKQEHFEIGINYPPEITVISYPPEVNPSHEYTVTFSVSDNFGVEDIVYAEVGLYHELRTPSERECYTYTWERPDGYTVWSSSSPVVVDVAIQNQEIVWDLTFSLSEIAYPGEWILDITAYDTDHQHDQVIEHFSVTKYLSFYLQGSSRAPLSQVSFGRAEPGETLPDIILTVVVTSNTHVNILVQGDDLYSPEGYILPSDIFFVKTTTGNRFQLDRSRQIVYSMHGKDGFNRDSRIVITFSGKLPDVIEAGTYSGIWYIIVEAV